MGILRADRITGLGGANAIKGSVFFDGASTIAVGDSDDFHYDTGDFTIEGWIFATGRDQQMMLLGQWDGSGSVAGSLAWAVQLSNDTNGFLRFLTSSTGTNVVLNQTGSSGTVFDNKWHHFAVTRNGNDYKLFTDGAVVASVTDSNAITNGAFSLTIGGSNRLYSSGTASTQTFTGFLSNIRIIKGEALYTAAFTPPTSELTVTSNTVFLGCQSSNILREETGKILSIDKSSTNDSGPIASKFTPNSPVGFSTTTDVGSQYGSTFDGFGSFATSTYMVPPGGNTRERNRGRAVFTGGYNAPQTGTTEMEFFNIQSGGLTEEFGNQSIDRKFSAGLASATRGVTGGSNGTPSWVTGTMEFVTIANASNTTTFGNMTAAGGMVSAHSNDTRGLFFSVWDSSGSGPAHKGHIDYITIATTGNSADFGQLSVSRPEAAGFGSPTRGICAGGYPAADGTTMSNVIDYVTISTLGNATDFGDLTQARQAVSGASSQTRGVVAGGYVYGSPAGTFNINTIDYITIATTGDALDFGDLIVGAMAKSVGNCSDQTRGVFTGGKTAAPTYINTIEIVTIATTGNASDFGDLKRTRAYGSVFCDSHGGLS